MRKIGRTADRWSALCFGLIVGVLSLPAARAQNQDSSALLSAQRALDERRPEEAARILTELLRQNPQLSEAWRLKAHAELAQNQRREARSSFLKALEGGRLSPDVIGNLALLDRESGALNAALTNARWLLVLEPDQPRWRDLLLDLLAATGAETEAQALLKAELLKRPEDLELQRRAGNLALARSDYATALETFTLAFYLGPRDARLARTIAELYFSLSEPANALAWMSKARELGAPESPEQALLRAQCLLDTEQHDAAQELLRSLADSRSGPWVSATRRLAALAQSRGDEAAALELLSKLPDEPALRYQRALLALRLKKPAEALAIIGSKPGDAPSQRLLARTLWQLDRQDEAIAALSQGIAEAGWDGEVEALLSHWKSLRRPGERDSKTSK